MHHFFIEQHQILETTINIKGSDVNHIKNVLRMKQGEHVSLSDIESGKEYTCAILQFLEEEIECEIIAVTESETELNTKIYLFQGLPKSDKMELIIQKAVELGVYEIIPVATKRCVVKLDEKKAKNKIARWQEISKAAAKQSKRSIVPKIQHVMTLKEALEYAKNIELKVIPYEDHIGFLETKTMFQTINEKESIAVYIGPEGGFDITEIELAKEYSTLPISLGKRILRTETAGFTILSWIMYHLEG
ncbi:MAG: 16S rRNA (uracil(1498)-N(3))-methyltransferase [Lachnospiraceae bacterium]